jgi:unspecific monooxygenase
MPFGAGPRACLGAQMATFQLVAATAHLASEYTIEITAAPRSVKVGGLLLPEGLRARFLPL